MLKQGTTAPDFEATLDDGTPFKLSQALADRAVVLYFYPRDFTPGCTRQACAFRDNFEAITEAGATIIGVSTDSLGSHASFKDRFDLPFPLIADGNREVIDAYDARGLFGISTARVTYVIARDGLIQRTIRHDLRVDQHVPEVLEALAEIAPPT
ncbi:MAG: peroxiredoxin [Dehalococcoidia bacterium]